MHLTRTLGKLTRTMLKKAIITGSAFMLVGAIVFGWVHIGQQRQQQRVVAYKSQYGAELNEHLQSYDQWIQTSPEDQLTLLAEAKQLGGQDGDDMAERQKQRLAADQDELTASGDEVFEPFAEVLYGDNWKQELEKHQTRREVEELALTGAAILLSIGCTIVGWCSLVCCWRLSMWTLLRFSKRGRALHMKVVGARQKRRKEPKGKVVAKPVAQSEPMGWPVERDDKGRLCISDDGVADSNDGNSKSVDSEPTEPLRSRRSTASLAAASLSESDMSVQTNIALSATAPNETMNTLNELSEQVLAIRQYVACQHDKVERLNDGHHWSAIRALCLRIVRCIDNIEDRIEQLSNQAAKKAHLHEIRDELLFALESSGVEQFVPEVSEEYRGQEKYAEAIKDREPSDDPECKGKIAKVVRPGYQYFVDDDHAKVVRTAQVKLYE